MQLSQKLKSMIYHIIVQYIVKKGDWNPFGQEEISRQINNVRFFFFL